MKIKTLVLSLSIFALACSGEDDNNSSNNATTPNNGTTTKNNKSNNKSNNKTTTGMTSACADQTTTIYTLDADRDGYAAVDSPSEVKCLKAEELASYILQNNDCNDNDLTQFPGSEGICGDHVVDSCDGADPIMDNGGLCQTDDEACPETQAAGVDEPTWNCTGDAPENVYAFATFDDGNEHFNDGACFVFFEGFKDGFYVKHDLDGIQKGERNCNSAYGCVCPSGYDRRLYAFTSDPAANNCPEISQRDHGCSEDLVQPASNDCRKYLDLLHPYEMNSSQTPFDHPYSYVAGSVEALEKRLTHFKTLEVACIDNSVSILNWETLMTGTIQLNPGFVKK